MIIDIHTHRPYPQPEGIISKALRPDSSETSEMKTCQLYSVGMHPWDTQDTEDAGLFARLEEIAAQPNVAAIGECGIDLLRGAPMFRQLLVFRRHVEISEKLRKPLIIHDVKADDIICGLRRDMKPTQPWCIHGFRGKPAAAMALIRSGCHISFGEKFNPDTLSAMPTERILAETDESTLPVETIIARLSEVKDMDLTEIIRNNSKKFCNFVS